MKFEYMDKAVDELCQSMEDNPGRWVIDIYTLNDTHTGIKYWVGSLSTGSITEISGGRANHQVFSYEQGQRMWAAYQKLRETKANTAQLRVLQKINKKEQAKDEMPFWLKVVACILLFVLVVSVFRSIAG